MSNRSVLRVAPDRDGVQIANAWRFWTQGDEFYAAARDAIKLGKISFHRNDNWQLRMGSVMQRLSSGLKLSNGWRHALEIAFLVDRGVLLPKRQREANVVTVSTPQSHKLLIDLVLTESAERRSFMPPEFRGSLLSESTLRSGKTLLVIGRVLPFTQEDDSAIQDMRSKLRVNFAQRLPQLGDVYVEAALTSFAPGKGNIMQVIPVGADSFAVDPVNHGLHTAHTTA